LRWGEQRRFLLRVKEKLNCSSDELGQLVGISGRSFRYWLREETIGEKRGLEILSKLSGVRFPGVVEEREEFWSGRFHGRKAALERMKIYGPPGTLEGRSKGGKISQQRRREDPDKYRALGCTVPNSFDFPKSKSNGLAEFIGITLGDGGITDGQVKITLNAIADKNYVHYVYSLIKGLFNYKPSVFIPRKENVKIVIVTGKSFVKFLLRLGMKVGDKVRQQVDVPVWIKMDRELSKWCLRGLVDTDGGIFTHRYYVNGKRYSYLKLSFANKSQPLRLFVHKTLADLGFTPKFASNDKDVWLYSEKEARAYLEVVGSSNHRLLRKIE